MVHVVGVGYISKLGEGGGCRTWAVEWMLYDAIIATYHQIIL